MTIPRRSRSQGSSDRFTHALLGLLVVLAPVALIAAAGTAQATHTIQCAEEGFLYWETEMWLSDGEYRNLASFPVPADCGLSLTVRYRYEVGETSVILRGEDVDAWGVTSFMEEPGTVLSTNSGTEDPVKVQTYHLDVRSTGFHLVDVKVKAYTVK